MNLSRYAIRRKAVMLVFIVMVIAGGIFSYSKLGRLEDPEFTIKEAAIYTSYPGANAEQVEMEVSDPLETAIQQLKQLKEVRSISRAGLSIIFAEIQETYDKKTLPQVWDELRRKVKLAARNLPPGCQQPQVNDDFGDVYGVQLALTGKDYSPHDLKEIAKDIRRELLLCQDVGRIDFWGIRSEVVYVEVNRNKIAKLGLAPTDIFNAIRKGNSITETGKVMVGPEDVRFRVTGDYSYVEELGEQLVQGGSGGRMIRLKDIARIERGYLDPPDSIMEWNGEPSVAICISTTAGGDVIAMGDTISKRLDELKGRLPVGIEIHPIVNQSETVKEAVHGFVSNLFEAVAIVIILLVLFMGLREGTIIGIVLLLTVLATLSGMQVMGIALQRISLGALIIALGMLVDNAIVVTEGIAIKTHGGMNQTQAVEETVHETQWPLLGATAIAILAFAAISLSKDMTGEWLKSLFQVICLSLSLSWLFAITITPYLCTTLLPADSIPKGELYGNLFYRIYRRIVASSINHRWITLGLVVSILAVALWGSGFVRQDFMPDMDRPQITVDVWMPEGTHIYRTAEEVSAIRKYIKTLDGVTDITSFIGQGPLRFLLTYEPEMPDSAYGQLLVSLDDYRKIPTLRAHLSAYLSEHYPEAITSVDAFKLGPGGGAVVARIIGPDANVLHAQAEKIKTIMLENDNTRSIRTDWGDPVKVETVHLAKARSQEIGITRPEVSQSLAMNFSGINAGVFRHDDDLLPIMFRPPSYQREGIENVDNVQVWSSSKNYWVPLGQLSNGQSIGWENPVIYRLNHMRILRVKCKQKTGTTNSLFRQLRQPIENVKLPEGYRLEWGGEHKDQVDANRKLMSNVPIAFMAMFLISVMLFNSLRHPLIIFLGLPLTFVGVVSGMLLADKPFGFMAMLGFLSLSGMMIKNEIVLLDQINLEIGLGKKPFPAVIDAATSRVRPVCMAAFTTVLGMAPLLRDAFFSPMAVTIMGGLTFSTILTLVVVPVLYSTFFGVHSA